MLETDYSLLHPGHLQPALLSVSGPSSPLAGHSAPCSAVKVLKREGITCFRELPLSSAALLGEPLSSLPAASLEPGAGLGPPAGSPSRGGLVLPRPKAAGQLAQTGHGRVMSSTAIT